MKFTESKDGALRTTVTVKHRIGRSDLVNLVCLCISKQITIMSDGKLVVDEDNVFNTRGKLVKRLKDELVSAGENNLDYWSDNCGANAADAILKHARVVVDTLFPELKA